MKIALVLHLDGQVQIPRTVLGSLPSKSLGCLPTRSLPCQSLDAGLELMDASADVVYLDQFEGIGGLFTVLGVEFGVVVLLSDAFRWFFENCGRFFHVELDSGLPVAVQLSVDLQGRVHGLIILFLGVPVRRGSPSEPPFSEHSPNTTTILSSQFPLVGPLVYFEVEPDEILQIPVRPNPHVLEPELMQDAVASEAEGKFE